MSGIPKPAPATRPRRSSFAHAAQTEAASDRAPVEAPLTETPTDGPGAASANEPPPAGPSPVARLQPAPSGPPQTKRLGGSKDILFSLPEEEKDRMINTIAWTTPRTGIRHQSKFIRYAIAKACEDLEREFNNGNSFPPPADAAL